MGSRVEGLAEVKDSGIQTACLYIKTVEGLYGRVSGFGLIISIGLLQGLQEKSLQGLTTINESSMTIWGPQPF